MASKKTTERFTVHKKECSWKDSEGRVNPGEHGTTAQYARALRVGATPCQACKTANTQKDLEYRRRKAKDKPADHVAAQRARADKAGPKSKGSNKATKVA